MAHLVNEEDVRRFQEDGAVCLRNIFDKTWIEKLEKGVKKNLADPSQFSENLKAPGGPGYYFNDYMNWKKIPEFEEFAFKSAAPEIVAKLFGDSKVRNTVHLCLT